MSKKDEDTETADEDAAPPAKQKPSSFYDTMMSGLGSVPVLRQHHYSTLDYMFGSAEANVLKLTQEFGDFPSILHSTSLPPNRVHFMHNSLKMMCSLRLDYLVQTSGRVEKRLDVLIDNIRFLGFKVVDPKTMNFETKAIGHHTRLSVHPQALSLMPRVCAFLARATSSTSATSSTFATSSATSSATLSSSATSSSPATSSTSSPPATPATPAERKARTTTAQTPHTRLSEFMTVDVTKQTVCCGASFELPERHIFVCVTFQGKPLL
jgi:hypothetical protein